MPTEKRQGQFLRVLGDRLKALQIAGVSEYLQTKLNQRLSIVSLNHVANKESFLQDQADQFECVITHAGRGCSNALIEQLPRLKVIFSWGVGFDKIDLEVTQRMGIQVVNTPDVLNECVADMTIAMILNQARGVSEAQQFIKRGDWSNRLAFPLGRKVTGSRLGIVGLGRIGAEVAKRASAFSMPIRYHNRHPRQDLPYDYERSLTDLAQWSDFLVLLCPGGAETHHLVNETVLKALGSDSVLINIARGSVVDQDAMVKLLLSGELGGAALDVFAQEPHTPHELLDLPNVLMLPHIASATKETRQAMSDLLIENIDLYLSCGQLKTTV